MVKTLFILNPKSGRKKGRDSIESTIRAAYSESGNAFDIHRCDRKEDLDELIAAALRDGYEAIFAVGGDGTVREIGTRLIGTDAVLGVLPTGSGNGLARHLGIPLDPASALESLSTNRVERIDTAVVNGEPFINVAGIGFDAVVAERFATSTVRGLETYVREGLKVFSSYAGEDYEIVIDGRPFRERAFLVAIANASQYGSGARIAPLASLQDGLLDLSLLHEGSLIAVPVLLQQLFTGHIHESSHVGTYTGREITIRRGAAGPAHLDGEPIHLSETLYFTIRPRSLRVLVPEGTTKF